MRRARLQETSNNDDPFQPAPILVKPRIYALIPASPSSSCYISVSSDKAISLCCFDSFRQITCRRAVTKLRLLNAESYQLKEFVGEHIPPYAILSHTWGNQEILYQETGDLETVRSRHAFWKVENCCAQARDDGWEWVWIDTCCIDKSSSAELSEAINSMFQWYEQAMVCYTYLSDIDLRPTLEARLRLMSEHLQTSTSAVQLPCRWFYRAWTLQELIAPKLVRFFGRGWAYLGSKADLELPLSRATGIYPSILSHKISLSGVSAGDKMRWASHRQATRVEDISYSLLGLFDVNMPLLYGEGKKAFYRLQEHILKTTEDHTLLVFELRLWNLGSKDRRGTSILSDEVELIAQSPKDFSAKATMMDPLRSMNWSQPSYTHSYPGRPGLRIHLPVRRLSQRDMTVLELGPNLPDLVTGLYLAALNLRPSPDLLAEIPWGYSTDAGDLMQTNGVIQCRIALLLMTTADEGDPTRDTEATECLATSRFILVPDDELDKWITRPLHVLPVYVLSSEIPGWRLRDSSIEIFHRMTPCAAASGLRMIDSGTLEGTRFWSNMERYWILTGLGEPVVAYFTFVGYPGKVISFIRRTSHGNSPEDVLRRSAWCNEKVVTCSDGMGLLCEDRFSIDERFDAVFLVVRRVDDLQSARIEIHFMIQKSLPRYDVA